MCSFVRGAAQSSIARLLGPCAALAFTTLGFAASARAESTEAAPAREPDTSLAEPPPYAAWQRAEPVPPPPPLELRPAPPPELPPLEYARRPLELAPEFLLGFESCTGGSVDNQRCAGVGPGAGVGLSALWRVSPYFAFGGTVDTLSFRFIPEDRVRLRDASAGGLFYGLLARVYFADHGSVEPYLELALGGGAARTNARELDDASYSETAGGRAVRLGGAVEIYLSQHLRLGPAFTWTRFGVQHVHRCGGSQACVELDPDRSGHGNGFATLSARLTISLGPGL